MKGVVNCLFIAMLFLSGCAKSPSQLSSGDYIKWIGKEENGLLIQKQLGEFVIVTQFRSPQSMALIRAGISADKKEWESALYEAGNMQYYFLSYKLNTTSLDILKYNMRDESEYFSRSNYLSFGVNKDVYVLCGKDSLPCRLHQFTPHYGLSPKVDLVFAFDEPDSLHSLNRTLVIEDQLFGLGILRFEFKADDIKNTPSISF